MTVWEQDFFGCEARACQRHDASLDARHQADQTAVCAIAGPDIDASLECNFPFIQPRRDCSSAAGGRGTCGRASRTTILHQAHLSVALHYIPGLPGGESYIFNNVKIGDVRDAAE
jgi:hypothetical protein